MRNKAAQKALSLILALCLTLTLAPLGASAQEILLGTSGGTVDSGSIPISDETPASSTDLAEILPQGGMMPLSINLDHHYVVGGNSYATLEEALTAVSSGGTIVLQKDANPSVANTITIEKNITFDLTDGNLSIWKSGGLTLELKNCIVSVTGGGYLDVTGGVGIEANNAAITVRNVTGNQGNGALAHSGGSITVLGDAQGYSGAARAYGAGSIIMVNGNALTTGPSSTVVEATYGGYVEVGGDVTTSGDNSTGISAKNSGTVYIKGSVSAMKNGVSVYDNSASQATVDGNVTASGANAYGVSASGGSIEVGGDVKAEAAGSSGIYANAGPITVAGNVSAGAIGVHAINAAEVTIGGTLTVSGSVYIQFESTEAGSGQYTTDPAKSGYRKYTDGTSIVWVKATTVPAYVCEIGSTGYPALAEALAAVKNNETITLLQDIDHVTDTAANVVRINGKTVIFDLAGHTLNVGDASVSSAVVVENGGKLELSGSTGALNVTAYGNAVEVEGIGSAATVTSATSVNNIAVLATGGGQITVRGDAVGNIHGVGAGAPTDTVGSTVSVGGNVKTTVNDRTVISAGKGSHVTVNGSVLTTGTGGYGVGALHPNTEVHIKGNVMGSFFFCVDASDSALVRVDGNVTSTYASSYVCGVRAQTKAEVIVGGNVSVNNQTGSTGVRVKSLSSQTPTKVTVDGVISGGIYIQLDGTDITEAQKTGTEAGYNTYTLTNTNGTHTVWIKATSAPTQLETPTNLAWDTATPGVIKAKWDQVTSAQEYTIMLFKNGSPVGPIGTSATSANLTAYIQASGTGSYTFRVRALAPIGSADYTDSATSPQGPAYSYTAPAAVPAQGNAWATLFTKSIFVRLSQGGFKAVQDKAYWTLGGNGASGNSIVGVTLIDSTEVQITLTNDINTPDALTITASEAAFADGTSPFSSPLSVRLDNPQTYVCTIDGVAYSSLKSALDFALAPTVDNKTIVLAADIRYEEPVVVEEKTLTFYLNGKNLVIDTSGTVTGDWLTASSLKVDNGSVSYTGEGRFTVCGERRGVEAINGGRARVSDILIKNPGQPHPGHYYVYGAHARYQNSEGEGSQITVTGDIRTLSGNPCDYAIGALAGQDSTVTVGGDIHLEGENVIGLSAGSMNDGNGTATAQNVTVTGAYATGVSAAGQSTATVNGAVTAAGAYAVGVSAELAENGSGGTVIVKGDAAATGANSTGVACFSSASATEKSTVTVDGVVSGQDYLNIDNAVRAKDAKENVSGGYWIYNGQYESIVKVKDPDGGTPGGNVPSAPQTLTATPGNGRVTLSWTAPASSGDSAVTGYQVSSDGGASWINVGLTTSYMFINLTNGTEYAFKVRAVSSAGSGAEASRMATPTAAPSVPTVPRNFTASPGFARVILNWDATMSNGGSSIIRYEVSKDNGADWTSAGLYTSYEFTGLTNGTEYTFKVRAVNSAGNGAEASASAMPSDSAQTSFTVNFYSNGALYTSRSVLNGSALGGSWPANPARSGYTFGGWFAGQSGSGTRYTSSSVISSNVDLYANWSYSGGGGNGHGGGGSYTPGTPTTTPEKKPDQPVTASAPVTATAGTGGAASAVISDKTITDAIAKAQADAKAQGKTANGTSVALNVTMPQGATSLTTTLTQSSLNSLVNAGVTSLEINGAPVSLGLDLAALKEIQKQSGGNVTISFTPATGLSDEARALIGNRPVYNITISYVKDGKTVNITNLGSGTATLSIPYTPASGEAVGYLFGTYVDANGKPVRIDGSAYDANAGGILIPTNHFSVYGVGYTAPSAKFTDIGKHWAKEAIDYAVGRGLLSGTSETTFAPDTAMTRGMLVTALGGLANVDTKAYTINSFTDVKADSAFRPYIEWAYKKGIIQGIGSQQFAPDRAITREEIAVIFANYAKATGYKLPITREATTYADASSIGSVYKTAVTAIQQAGIMMGGTGNRFNPKSSATRAEFSSMLHRYIKLTIDPATAQGWAKNDAGQYLYYRDGKAVTGTQTIDGVKYFFETNGTLKTGWVQDGGNWYFYSGNIRITGWWDIGANGNNKRYYFDTYGIMVAGKWLQIDGKWYYFYADASLAKSTKVDGYEIGPDGARKPK